MFKNVAPIASKKIKRFLAAGSIPLFIIVKYFIGTYPYGKPNLKYSTNYTFIFLNFICFHMYYEKNVLSIYIVSADRQI